ncbi:hypothetical protein MMC07_008543 [Pseudocyphellaria aurata]|nr:hypothetical protein [Pseudocyphellaria aurata]
MATNAKAGAAPQLASARVATAIWKVSSNIVISGQVSDSKQKHTVQSTGIWERIRRALAVEPNRSNGVPLNAQYRNPPPGANPPEAYDDPVTVPAGDIADNAYYQRDIRRNYPRLSVIKQADIVGLLSVGSKANPKHNVLQIGDAGAKQLVQMKQEGEEKGLAALFKKNEESTMSVLGQGGLPPFPSGMNRVSSNGEKKYVMDADRTEGFPEEYPCRTQDVEPGLHFGEVTASRIARSPGASQRPGETTLLDFEDFYPVKVTYPTIFERSHCSYGKSPKALMSEPTCQSSYLTPLDIIVSCSICQQSICDIYAAPEQSDGLRQGPDLGNGKITRLWLAECGHFTCTKHLAGGGPQFYPSPQKPQAPCPLCSRERGDFSNKSLFWVNGVSSGEYSLEIPKAYFQTPPLRLAGDDPDLEALRFQYLSLLRYGSTKQAKVVRLENELKVWEDRRPLFKHCVTSFDKLQRELQAAREKLLEFNQDVSSIDATLKLTGSNQAENRNSKLVQGSTSEHSSNSNRNHISTHNRSRLAQASAYDLDELKSRSNVRDSNYTLERQQDYAVGSGDSSAGKRRRIDSRSHDTTQRVIAHRHPPSITIHSRDAMPPPSLPAQVPRTPKTAINAHNGRTVNSPLSKLIHSVNVNRKFTTNPIAPNCYSPSFSPICSVTKSPFYLTQNQHESLFAARQQYQPSPQISGDPMTPVHMSPQGFRQQPSLTSLHRDQIGVQSFPQAQQSHSLLHEAVFPPVESYINPYGRNLFYAREPDISPAEFNNSSDMLAGTDPLAHRTDSMGDCLKEHTNTHPNGEYLEIPSDTGSIDRGFCVSIGSKRRLGSPDNCACIHNGELDHNIRNTSGLSSSTFRTPPIRLSLPHRGPSSMGTPRLRTGMSANARSSNKTFILPTPITFRPHREQLNNIAMSNPYLASPYFSHQRLRRPPQISPLSIELSKSPGQTKTLVEAPFQVNQQSRAGSNRPMLEHCGGRSGFRAGPSAHRAIHGRGSSATPCMRRARR